MKAQGKEYQVDAAMIGGQRPNVKGVCVALQAICDRRGINARRIVAITELWSGADNSQSEVEIPEDVWFTACVAVDPGWSREGGRIN
jgi:hypothetical protein